MEEIISVSSSSANSVPAQNQEGPQDWGASVPENYGTTRIVLLPRDPRWLYSYWEVTEISMKEIISKFGADVLSKALPTIRRHLVLNKSGKAQSSHFVDVTVALEARSWYLQVEEEGTSWFVELGLKLENGEFIVIARSNYVTLPRARMSSLTDERWASLKSHMEEILTQSGGGKVGGTGSLELSKKLAERWELLIQSSSWSNSGGISSSLIHALRKS